MKNIRLSSKFLKVSEKLSKLTVNHITSHLNKVNFWVKLHNPSLGVIVKAVPREREKKRESSSIRSGKVGE